MDKILTFFYNILQSLLNLFSVHCRRFCRRGARRLPVADVEGVLSEVECVDEKTGALLAYNPTIECPMIVPTPDDPHDDFVEVSLDGEDTHQNDILTHVPRKATPPEETVDPLQNPARAKLLDILIQFPLPPSSPKDDSSNGTPVRSLMHWGPKLLGLASITRQNHAVRTVNDFEPHTTTITLPSPSTSRRSSLVWFADKSGSPLKDNTHTPELSDPESMYWVPVHRATLNAADIGSSAAHDDTNPHPMSPRWISEWRDDMATVLKSFQEVDMHDENFRDLFANMSVSTEGYCSIASSLSSSEPSALDHVDESSVAMLGDMGTLACGDGATGLC